MASKSRKKRNPLVVVSVLILLFVTVGVFFCIKAYVNKQKNKSVLVTNTITMNYTSEFNGLMIPATSIYNDQDGKLLQNKENVFDFVVSSKIKNSTKTKYNIYLQKDQSSNIPDDMVRVYLESSEDEKYTKVKRVISPIKYKDSSNSKLEGMLLKSDTLSKSTKLYFRLKVWIDPSYVPNNPNDYFKATVNISAE